MRPWRMRRLLRWHLLQRYQTLQLRRSLKRAETECLSRTLCAPLLHWSKMASVTKQWRYSIGTRRLEPMSRAPWAGRIKRMWLENEDPGFAQHALALYQEALDEARKIGDVSQIYYHSINVAFLEFVALDHVQRAHEMAELALESASLAKENAWSIATQAEANLYLGHRDLALDLYQRMLAFESEPWEYASTALQAGRIASKLKDSQLADRLEEIFTPTVRQANMIFVSYSHEDEEWKNRFCQMLAPFLRDGDLELQLWVDDGEIQSGDRWHEEIQSALKAAGVAVVLVSASFLGSEYVMKFELPEIIRAATDGKLRLFWVYLSYAAYDATGA